MMVIQLVDMVVRDNLEMVDLVMHSRVVHILVVAVAAAEAAAIGVEVVVLTLLVDFMAAVAAEAVL